MPQYRKKPVVIEAFKYNYDDIQSNLTISIPRWFLDAVISGTVYEDSHNLMCIKTLEGIHSISDGDFVIQGIKGELYPCKPDIFEASYELAE